MGLLDWLFGEKPKTPFQEYQPYWNDWREGRQHKECKYLLQGIVEPYVCPRCGGSGPWLKVAYRHEVRLIE